jgi:transposase InsO family protein
VLTDRGGEWASEFQQLLLDCMIDHRRTSANHPQADGLAERCVGTMKRSLSKLCAAEGSQAEWDRHLPWLMLGYNCSPSKATNLSPYQLMHAVTPTVPPAIRERLASSVDLDNPEVAGC